LRYSFKFFEAITTTILEEQFKFVYFPIIEDDIKVVVLITIVIKLMIAPANDFSVFRVYVQGSRVAVSGTAISDSVDFTPDVASITGSSPSAGFRVGRHRRVGTACGTILTLGLQVRVLVPLFSPVHPVFPIPDHILRTCAVFFVPNSSIILSHRVTHHPHAFGGQIKYEIWSGRLLINRSPISSSSIS